MLVGAVGSLHENAEERGHHQLQTGQVGGRTQAGGRCILWMGRHIFYGPRLTLTDGLNDVAEQETTAADFRSRGRGGGGARTKRQGCHLSLLIQKPRGVNWNSNHPDFNRHASLSLCGHLVAALRYCIRF